MEPTHHIVLPSHVVGLSFFCKSASDDDVTTVTNTEDVQVSKYAIPRKTSVFSKSKSKSKARVQCRVLLPFSPSHYTQLVVDPGSSSMGVRCETLTNSRCSTLHLYTTLTFRRTSDMLSDVMSTIPSLFEKYSPDILVIERQLHKTNYEVSIVSHAIAGCAATHNIPCVAVDPVVMRSTFGIKPDAGKDSVAQLGLNILVDEGDEESVAILDAITPKKSAQKTTVSTHKQQSDMLDAVVMSRTFHTLLVWALKESATLP